MVQDGQITLYHNVYSPFSQRVLIALKEAKVDYAVYMIDFKSKPAWFVERVNPIGKVPAITYGGPQASPDDPSPESFKLRESLVILEFLADLFPDSGLLPKDIQQRAQARLAMNLVETVLLEGFRGFFFRREPVEKLLDALDRFQKALPPKGFAIGEHWNIADIAAAPILARTILFLDNDLGFYAAGEGPRVRELLRGEQFARLNQYIADIKAQPSFNATWDDDHETAAWTSNPMFKRQ